ncbi:MAG TPA: hypothetical protein VFQ71_01450 [Gaiellales bacterium]|nr:hypothetical protein [Gaiellales bacterium]
MDRDSRQPTTDPSRCTHCHQPIYVVSPDVRWRGYCDICARHLAGRIRHLESA